MASLFTSMPLRRAMLYIVSPRWTTCTCGRLDMRVVGLSTRAAASNTFAGNAADAEGTRRSVVYVSAPVGRSFISRTTVGVVLKRFAAIYTLSPRDFFY